MTDMVLVYGTGNGTGNEIGGMKETGNVSGRLAGNGSGAMAEAGRSADCWFATEGGAASAAETESTSVTDCVGDETGKRHHLQQPWRTGWARQARGEGRKAAWGRAEEEEWKQGEEGGGRRGEGKDGSRRSCWC